MRTRKRLPHRLRSSRLVTANRCYYVRITDSENGPSRPSPILGDNNQGCIGSAPTERKPGYALPTTDLRSQKPTGNLKTGRFVTVEIRVVAEENEALQSVGLDEHFARYPFSFYCELVDKSVDGSGDGSANHIVASRLLDVVSDGFGKQPELGDGVLAPIRSECRLEISAPIRNGERQPILFRVPHAPDEELYIGVGEPRRGRTNFPEGDWRSRRIGVTAES